ncbi:unnamed protein product, partial [Meganyctiphanes norvegica]
MNPKVYNSWPPMNTTLPCDNSSYKIFYRLVLKFQSGPSGDPNDEIGLCMYGRPAEGIVGCNAFTRSGGWGQEAAVNTPALVRGQTVEITILCDPTVFKIAMNRSHLTEFHHRLNPASLNHLNISSTSNDITISCVWIEDTAQPAAPAPPYAQAPSTSPPYGTPGPNPQQTSSTGGYAPPPGMYPGQQAPPSGQYHGQAPPGQYPGQQAPPGQYPGAPPPPPGHYPSASPGHHSSNGMKQKGLMGMVAGAGAAVAGAMGASHLIGKSKHGGGYPGMGSGGYPGMGGGGYPNMGGGGYPNMGGGYPSHHSKGGSGIMDKAIGLGTTAYMVKNPKYSIKYYGPFESRRSSTSLLS